MGGISRNIKYCVNVLNRLFRSEEWHLRQQEQIIKAKETLTNFENQSLVAEN
jgi:succinylglutamate desuccinylase